MPDSVFVSVTDITIHRRLTPHFFFQDMDYWKLAKDKEKAQKREYVEENNNQIPPSDVPSRLPTMTDDEIARMEVTVTPPEVIPGVLRRDVAKEPVSEEGHDSTEVDVSREHQKIEKESHQSSEEGDNTEDGEESDEEEKRGWKRQRKDLEEPSKRQLSGTCLMYPRTRRKRKTRKSQEGIVNHLVLCLVARGGY